ncbi:MAG: ABC transporter permease, partial [Chloroflexi bacterium]|nr:ABC transporter permease [Chloroflexota bacterium]MCI0576569.1 ABC transporter permease [Chloroflexota bacterium]MCI0643800.1 ABC transporter permease [Chloroflexota bacterium]MCI0726913.1 ABC transporter permease [Chloroflexota bacterium]
MLRRLWAFFARDFYTEVSYRVAFLINFLSIFFSVFTFFFVSKLIGDRADPFLAEYGGNYFSFVLVGIAFSAYFGLGLSGFARALRDAQTTGTLEALLMTPTPVSVVVVGSALWNYAFTSLRVLAYLFMGALFLGFRLGRANYLAALASLLLSVTLFASIGIIAASVIMVIKRGEPITGLFAGLANLLAGVYYPVEILPDWLQAVAKVIPVTYALRAMRLSLLVGASWTEIGRELLILAAFTIVLFPISLVAFRAAVERARYEGTLAHY